MKFSTLKSSLKSDSEFCNVKEVRVYSSQVNSQILTCRVKIRAGYKTLCGSQDQPILRSCSFCAVGNVLYTCVKQKYNIIAVTSAYRSVLDDESMKSTWFRRPRVRGVASEHSEDATKGKMSDFFFGCEWLEQLLTPPLLQRMHIPSSTFRATLTPPWSGNFVQVQVLQMSNLLRTLLS